ncbi:MAG: transposase family protein [Thiothrix litoralis]|uniref:helix-turn-helix domain-containing protein n=1 Tax=Thiothrix litoralis TaxID=2891210 RepID=UPI003C711E84
MAEYSFNALKSNEKAFVAMTSLNVKEFQQLLEPFTDAYRADLQARGKRLNETRGRSDGKLALMEDKLLFILFYLKTYPLQEVLAYSFGLPQSVANQWIHCLCPVLQCALEKMGHKPVRLSSELMDRLIEEGQQNLIIDGTERRIQRPVDDNVQKDYYSGKKKLIPLKIMSSLALMTEISNT